MIALSGFNCICYLFDSDNSDVTDVSVSVSKAFCLFKTFWNIFFFLSKFSSFNRTIYISVLPLSLSFARTHTHTLTHFLSLPCHSNLIKNLNFWVSHSNEREKAEAQLDFYLQFEGNYLNRFFQTKYPWFLWTLIGFFVSWVYFC